MLFITATDTDVGKTFFAKSLIKFLLNNNIYSSKEICYFKPIQAGIPTDFDEIKNETKIDVYCSYPLNFPASPDYASSLEQIKISSDKIQNDFLQLQNKYKYIIVEGAGGVAVPINDKELMSDLIKKLNLETVIVTRPDLGTINHSLISFEHLNNKNIKIKGFYVSAKTRTISEQYNISEEKKYVQNSKALESIIKFTKSKILKFSDFV